MTESLSTQFIRFACKHCGTIFSRIPYERIAHYGVAQCSSCGKSFSLDKEELRAALREAMDNEARDAGDSLDIEEEPELDAEDSLDIEEDRELDAGEALDIEEKPELDAEDSLDIEEDRELDAEEALDIEEEPELDAGEALDIEEEPELDAGNSRGIEEEAELDAVDSRGIEEEPEPVTDDSPDQVHDAAQQPARPMTGFEPEKENKVEFARRLSRLIPEGWVNPSLDHGTAAPADSTPVASTVPDIEHLKDHRQFVVFELGETEFAVAVENTTEISMVPELTRLPHVPAWLLGIINLRGDIVSVIDMKNFLGMGSFDVGTSDRIILLRSLQEDRCTAIIVNRIIGMQYVDEKELILNEAGRQNAEQHILGIFEKDERSIVVLDIDNLLLSDDMQQFRAL